jgi:hypothetical protein
LSAIFGLQATRAYWTRNSDRATVPYWRVWGFHRRSVNQGLLVFVTSLRWNDRVGRFLFARNRTASYDAGGI